MILRIVGFALAPIAIGMALSTTKQFDNPVWRYWQVAAMVVFDVTLLYYRVRLVTRETPITVGDVGFVLGNALVIIGCVLFLRSRRE